MKKMITKIFLATTLLLSMNYVSAKTLFETLEFDQPFGTQSWTEDGYNWSWDNSGWDNIREYSPHTGSGHAMTAPDYGSKLSTTANIDIHGIWIKVDMAQQITNLQLEGYNSAGDLMYTEVLNPMAYQFQYAYVVLNWTTVKSFKVNYSELQQGGASVYYDDMEYTIIPAVVPPTKIRDLDCGRTLSNVSQVVYADIVANATSYQFKVVNTTLGFTYETPSNYAARYIRLMDVPGIQTGTQYQVSVKAYVGPEFGEYDVACSVTTPSTSVPNTQVIPNQCGIALNSSSTVIYANPVSGATDYIFEVSNSTVQYLVTKTAWAGGRAIKLSQLAGILPNTTYDIRVKVIVGGVTGNYSGVCQVATPSSGMMAEESARFAYNGEDESLIENLTALSIYPNPNTGEQLNLSFENLTPNTTLTISDIYGKIVMTKPLNTDQSEYRVNVKFENKLSAGFYLVSISSEGNTITEKLIVR